MSTGLVYIRQSRHRDYERTASPEVQLQACLELPAIKACNNVERFQDLDRSGGKLAGRVGYVALIDRIERAKPNEIRAVAAYDQSRAFRNTQDALNFYALLEKRPWIEVVFVHGRFDRSPAGEFTYTAMAAAHAMERRMTSEKMRDAVRFRSAKGEMVGQVPAGYRRTPDGGVTIDEDVADLIHHIFEEYASGRVGARGIARRLNVEGRLLPSARTAWRGDTIIQLMANVAYTGKTYSVSRRRQEGELIDGKWPAIIEPELWRAVQHLLTSRAPSGGRSHEDGGARYYPFQKLLRCVCGRRMHAQMVKAVAYYRCPGTDASEPCRAFAREADLLPWARDLFERLEGLAPRPLPTRAAKSPKGSRQFQSPDALAQIERTIERLGKRFEWGHIDEVTYQTEWKRLRQLQQELASAASEPAVVPLEGVLEAWDQGDALIRRQLLGNLFAELDVERGRVIRYQPRTDRAATVVKLMEKAWVGIEPRLEVRFA